MPLILLITKRFFFMSSVSLVLPDNGTTTLRYIAEDMIRSLAKRTNFPEDYKLVLKKKLAWLSVQKVTIIPTLVPVPNTPTLSSAS